MNDITNYVTWEVLNRIEELNDELSEALGQGILKSTILVRNAVLRKLSGARSGKLYRVPGTKRFYRASAAGESPATRLGHLRASYQYKVLGNGVKMKGFVGSQILYAHYLEYGTYKMAPRPHLIPAMKESKPKIEKLFKKVIK